MAESNEHDELDLDGLAAAFNDLIGKGLDKADVHQIVSAEATQAVTPIMIAEAVQAAGTFAVSEAMEAVVMRAEPK
jgi:hypothetical protein